MPTYDYVCPNGDRFEVIHGVTAEGPTICPICGASPVRKAFSAPSIVFKGSGWAKKDRSATSKPAASSASSDGSPKTTDAAGAKTDGGDGAKPAAGDSSSASSSAAAD